MYVPNQLFSSVPWLARFLECFTYAEISMPVTRPPPPDSTLVPKAGDLDVLGCFQQLKLLDYFRDFLVAL